MRISRFFDDLSKAYSAELDDLRTDSEGKDILRSRLAEKRKQVQFLLPMLKSNPEMVAVAFHGGFRFMNPLVMETLTTKEAKQHPSWKSLSESVKLEPWAEPLCQAILKDADGAAFMVTAAGLEYLAKSKHSRQTSPSNAADMDAEDAGRREQDDATSEQNELKEGGDLDGNYGRHGRDDGDDGDDYDLEEAGADWLAEQGFDRKD